MAEHAAVILAGGAGRRLGGVDKPQLVVDGRSLLDTAIDACESCAEVVVVGPSRPTQRRVTWAIEDPPGSGPLAALAAGLAALPTDVATVTVLAADLPSVTADAVSRLHEALATSSADAVLLTDDDGQWQPLAAAYARTALDDALGAVGDPGGTPVRAILPHLRIATLADPRAAEDIDTPQDLARWMRQPPDATAPRLDRAAHAREPQRSMTMDRWIAALCEELGVPIDDVDVPAILDLAKDAAHNVERPAAPVTAFIAGYAAGSKGGGSAAVDAAVDTAADLAAQWPEREVPAGPVEGTATLDGAPGGIADPGQPTRPDTPEG